MLASDSEQEELYFFLTLETDREYFEDWDSEFDDWRSDEEETANDCPDCLGVGDIEETLSPCQTCSGTGYVD